MIAVTQFILITVVYVIAFISLSLHDSPVVGHYLFLGYYLNHLSNFFIFLAVNKDFRSEAGNLMKDMRDRLLCKK